MYSQSISTPSKPHKYLHNYFINKQDKTCVIYDDSITVQTLSYHEVNKLSSQIETVLLENAAKSGFIGVLHPMNHLFPCIQLGILKSGCAFFNMKTRCETDIKILKIKYLLTSEKILEEEFITEIKIKIDLNEKGILYLIKLKSNEEIMKPFEFAYAMQTSGTSGIKKFVLVPHACITPNIQDFIDRVWKLDGDDVFWGSSPCSFDPCICDLFCSMGSGGTILYTHNALKEDGLLLGRILKRHKVSVIQTTPSLLSKLGKDLKQCGLFSGHTLKVLALGGEKCISKEGLRALISETFFMSMRALVNLYGLTEMSVWASWGHIDLFKDGQICLTENLLDTETSFEKNGDYFEVFLESTTRICTIIDENGSIIQKEGNKIRLPTGDLAILHERKYEIISRSDKMIKRHGMKIPLDLIEKQAMQTGTLKSATAVEHKNKIYLIIVPKSEELGLEKNVRAKFFPSLKLKIHPEFYPNSIIAVPFLDITENGKVDVDHILKIAEAQQYKVAQINVDYDTVKNLLRSLWLIATGGRELEDDVCKERFYEFSGTSATGIWMFEAFFSSLSLYGSPIFSKLQDILLRKLALLDFGEIVEFIRSEIKGFDAKFSVINVLDMSERREIKRYYHEEPGNEWKHFNFQNCDHSINFVEEEDEKIISFPFKTIFLHEFDLNMCIDASPVVCRKGINLGIAIVGSHSGTMIAVDTLKLGMENKRIIPDKTNAVLWTRCFPERLEADVVFCPRGRYAFIGCHDKMLYKLSVVNGLIEATFACEEVIRTKVAVNYDSVVVVDNANFVYCLETLDLQIRWKVNLQTSPTNFPVIEENLILLTTETGLTCFCLKSGKRLWPSSKNRCCTCPVIWNSEKLGKVVVCGTLCGFEIRNFSSGDLILQWRETNSEIFFTPIIHNCKKSEIILTSAKGRCLRAYFSNEGLEVENFTLDEMNCEPALCCNNDKKCFFLLKPKNCEHFMFIDETKKFKLDCYASSLDNFSRPVIYKDLILFGGRDNIFSVCFMQMN